MKIIAVSDTHLNSAKDQLPKKMLDDLKDADLLLHAGDIVQQDVLERLRQIKPTVAVSGNMDSAQLRRSLPDKKIIELGAFKIGLIHGWGSPHRVLDNVKEAFEHEKNIACVIYGHTHTPRIDNVDGVIYLNPGSATDKVYAPYNSYAAIEINKEIVARLIKI